MIPIELLPLRLGRSAAEPISEKEVAFYTWLASSILGKRCRSGWKGSKTTIPIEGTSLNSSPSEIYSRVIKEAESLNKEAIGLIIDVANPRDAEIRGGFELHLGQAIEIVVGNPARQQDVSSILLIPKLPPEGDALQKLLLPLIASKRLIVLADDGLFLGDDQIHSTFKDEEYRMRLSRIRGVPVELLREKLIRRLGHFKRGSDTQAYCLRHYFDGRRCCDEIRLILKSYISEKFGAALPQIVYDCEPNEWFASPVLSAADELGLICFSIKEITQQDKTIDSALPTLVVSFLIDTAAAILNVVKQIQSLHPTLNPKVFSILSTDGESELSGERSVKRGNTTILCDYSLRVERHRKPHKDCVMCDLDIPESVENSEPKMLTSYDFWEIALANPPHPEKDVPRNRMAIEHVPNFRKMIERNGPWLASKVAALIDLASDDATTETVIVCPDEIGSKTLARYLDLVAGATVILIPKKVVLNKLYDSADSSILFAQWTDKSPAWVIALRTLSVSDVIVMDEFSESLGTFHALKKLLSLFNKGIRCFIPMVDFNPLGSAKLGIQKYSLYEWQRKPVLTNS